MPDDPSLPHVAAGELLVARLWAWRVDKLMTDAEVTYGDMVEAGHDHPQYGVSAWVTRVGADGDVLAAMKRLALEQMPRLNAKWVAFAPEHRFTEEGFTLEPSPPPGHVNVMTGTTLDQSKLERLEALWNEKPRRRFADCTLP